MADLLRTPFYDYHVKFGARMVEYAGWQMPLLYKDAGIIAEHNHTRNSASLFDVSHMGRLRITGKEATAFLDRVLTRNVSKGVEGQCLYSLVCNESGGILDDIIVSRNDEDGHNWLMVCNAANRDKIIAWLAQHSAGRKVRVEDETLSTSMVAVQGPKVMSLLDDLLPEPPSQLKRYHFHVQKYMMMISFTVARTGYTGEDGVEIICGNKAAMMAVNFLAGKNDPDSILKPAGLGARDTLRLEAGMPLYGHELSETGDPLSAGLGWAVDLNKDFIGADALRKVAEKGPAKKLVGLFIDGPRSARQDMPVLSNGQPVGIVTSGAMSPTLNRPIAMAYVDPGLAAPDTKLTIDMRGTQLDATVTPLPFYKRPKAAKNV